MRRGMLLLLVPILWLPETAAAEAPTFPYEAVIHAEEAYVRSGPGQESYYPTSLLKRGAKVMVHRHDPGGWYMIAPPADSFNWIRADYVQRQQGNRGTVTSNDVVVGIGTIFGDHHDVWHTKLSKGDEVVILGEQTIRDDRGAVPMLKIQPPKGEWRWINGQHVARGRDIAQQVEPAADDPFGIPPATEPAKQPAATKPIEKPSAAPRVETKQVSQSNEPSIGSPQQPAPMTVPSPSEEAFGEPEIPVQQPATRETAMAQNPMVVDRAKLRQLDNEFRTMLQKTTAEWSFDSLEAEYRSLQQSTKSPTVGRQIDNTLQVMERYKKIKSEYDAFKRLTSETDQRDAALLSQRAPKGAPAAGAPAGAGNSWKQKGAGAPMQTIPGQPQQLQSAPQATQVTPQMAQQGVPGQPVIPGQQLQPGVPPNGIPGQPGVQMQTEIPGQPNVVGQPFVEGQPVFNNQAGVPTQPVINGQPGVPGAPANFASGQPANMQQQQPFQQFPQQQTQQPVFNGQQFAPPGYGGQVASPTPPQTPVTSTAPTNPMTQGVQPALPLGQTQRIDGAGVIQRMPQSRPGVPPHVLVTPQGRVIAYLEAAPGVNLDGMVGQSMGVYGERAFRQDLRAPQITVQGALPVQLQQQGRRLR